MFFLSILQITTALNKPRFGPLDSITVSMCKELRKALSEKQSSLIVVRDCVTCSSESWGSLLTVEWNFTIFGESNCPLRWLTPGAAIRVQGNTNLKFLNLTISVTSLTSRSDHPSFLQVSENGSIVFDNVVLLLEQQGGVKWKTIWQTNTRFRKHVILLCNKTVQYKKGMDSGGRRLKSKLSQDIQETGDSANEHDSKDVAIQRIGLPILGLVLGVIALCLLFLLVKRLTFHRRKTRLVDPKESQSGFCANAQSTPQTNTGAQLEEDSFQIDKAKFEFQIGKGEHGCVYKAEYGGQTIAIKVILAKDVHSRASLEAQHAQNALHPNVIRSYCTIRCISSDWKGLVDGCDEESEASSCSDSLDDFITSASTAVPRRNTWLIVMEFCDLGSLKDLLKDFDLQTKLRGSGNSQSSLLLKIALDISKGMLYLHQKNVLHGDLKPQNILLKSCPTDAFGFVAKIGDLGLSRNMTHTALLQTKTCGSVRYMSPELLREGLLSMKTDVYSFGMVLWEMVLGTEPFFGKSEVEVMLMVSSGKRPHSLGSVQGELGAIMRLCLQQEYADRPGFGHIVSTLEGHYSKQEKSHTRHISWHS
eukprot:g1960.t1